MMYLWLKALHIVFMVTWFAGLFYLPRLYVYHAMPENAASYKLFMVMERRLFMMMSIGGVLTALFGLAMLMISYEWLAGTLWFYIKALCVGGLLFYHYCCYRIMLVFRQGENSRTPQWYRLFNEVPSVLLILIVVLAVTKAF